MPPEENGPEPKEEPRLVKVSEQDGVTTFMYRLGPDQPRVQIEHDREKRLFRVPQDDGTTAVFRDEPVRFLVATLDPVTGAVNPMLRYGEPEYLLLCREDRERGQSAKADLR
jgi:hypothetical protein